MQPFCTEKEYKHDSVMVPVPRMWDWDHGSNTYRLRQCCDLCYLLGKVLVPAKLCEKNPEIGKIHVVKSSYWEIGIFDILLPNT